MDGAIALGVFTGLMIIIPYIGIALGLGIGILSAILQFGFGTELIWVLAIFGYRSGFGRIFSHAATGGRAHWLASCCCVYLP